MGPMGLARGGPRALSSSNPRETGVIRSPAFAGRVANGAWAPTDCGIQA
jgi:hypothetical protein